MFGRSDGSLSERLCTARTRLRIVLTITRRALFLLRRGVGYSAATCAEATAAVAQSSRTPCTDSATGDSDAHTFSDARTRREKLTCFLLVRLENIHFRLDSNTKTFLYIPLDRAGQSENITARCTAVINKYQSL